MPMIENIGPWDTPETHIGSTTGSSTDIHPTQAAFPEFASSSRNSRFALKNERNAAIKRYGGSWKLSDYNPYQAYEEGSVASEHPMRLVVALYEGALGAVQNAGRCLEGGDILGRSKAVNKALRILTELLISLDCEKGGEISLSLKQLYGYMQTRLVEAHVRQSAAPLHEVEKLLATLIEGWRGASSGLPHTAVVKEELAGPAYEPELETAGMPYAAYWSEPLETRSGAVFSF